MPQLIALGLIGGLVWYAWRALKRQMEAVGEEVKRRESSTCRNATPSVLEKGEDGVYRPKKDNMTGKEKS